MWDKFHLSPYLNVGNNNVLDVIGVYIDAHLSSAVKVRAHVKALSSDSCAML